MRRPQFGMLDMLLLLALAGVVSSVVLHARRAKDLHARIARLRELTGGLNSLAPPDQFQAASLHTLRYDDHAWNVRLPQQDGGFRLCLATREIVWSGEQPAATADTAPIAPGDHVVTLRLRQEQDERLISVLVDDVEVIRHFEPAQWSPNHSASMRQIRELKTQSTDEPLELYHSKHHDTEPPIGIDGSLEAPGNGARLWIERE